MMNFSLVVRRVGRTFASPSLRRAFSAEVNAEAAPLTAETQEIVKTPVLDALGRSYATGRRKTSVARVWLKEGSGQFVVNGKNFVDYFQPVQRQHVMEPFAVTHTSCLFDIMCTVKGGGISGQAGAVRLGISRALDNLDGELRSPLRTAGLLTRDSRRVERKKPGQKKARKQYQWVKR